MSSDDVPGGAFAVVRRAIPPGARESGWQAADGHSIRRFDWPAPGPGPARGSLLYLPGLGDAYEKVLEALAHWHDQGWSVTALDWRGQAGSGRATHHAGVIHVDDFATWIDDLAGFWREWAWTAPGPRVVVAHSMGGHLALRALAEGGIDPAAAVLVAPMLGVNGFGLPARALHGVARFMAAIGDRARPAWRHDVRPGMHHAARMSILTHDAERYADDLFWREARPELAMGPPSWGWVERALASVRGLDAPGVLERVACPVLLLGTRHDKLVRWRAIARAARRLPRAELFAWGSEARHEILREVDAVRGVALARIDAFLDARAAPDRVT